MGAGLSGRSGDVLLERDLVVRLHRTKEDIPANGTVIDATAPIARVVDEILRHAVMRTPTS
jgi:hypothetical protein